MNENLKGLIAFLIVFLALLIMGIIEAIFAAPVVPSDASLKIQHALSQSIKYRDGVVLLWERPSGKMRIYGNRDLLREKFLPGSLMKLTTTLAAIDTGVDPAYRCTGRQKTPAGTEYCWTPKGHGEQHLVQALGQSCNLYFWNLGQSLGWQALATAWQKLDLTWPPGFTPEGKALGDAAIGEATPLSLSPEEVSRMWEAVLRLESQGSYHNLFRGMEAAVRSGTASALADLDISVIAKTGTGDAGREPYPTHGWIVAATPAENPRWAMVVFLKNAHGYGEPTALAKVLLENLPREEAGEALAK